MLVLQPWRRAAPASPPCQAHGWCASAAQPFPPLPAPRARARGPDHARTGDRPLHPWWYLEGSTLTGDQHLGNPCLPSSTGRRPCARGRWCVYSASPNRGVHKDPPWGRCAWRAGARAFQAHGRWRGAPGGEAHHLAVPPPAVAILLQPPRPWTSSPSRAPVHAAAGWREQGDAGGNCKTPV